MQKFIPSLLITCILLTLNEVSYGQYLGAIRGIQRGLFQSSALNVYTHRNPARANRPSRFVKGTSGEPFVYILNGKPITNTRRVRRILSRKHTWIDYLSLTPSSVGGKQAVLINYRRVTWP